MATIRPNDNAPSEETKFIFPTATFDLSSGGSYETDDRALLAAAEVHPWLEVEYPEAEQVSYVRESGSVPYQEDVLSAPNSKAFDADEIRKTEEAKAAVYATPTAIESGLDQGKEVEVGDTAVTLAADEAADDAADDSDNDTPARSSRRRAAAKKED
jgi:hypothetical protein